MWLIVSNAKGQKAIVNVDLRKCEDFKCPACGSIYFVTSVVRVKIVSPVVSPTGELSFVVLPVLSCANCGYVIDENEVEEETREKKLNGGDQDVGLS